MSPPASASASRSSGDVVARWLVLGLLGGLAAGVALVFPRAGASLGGPVLAVLVAMLAGGAVGAALGLFLSARTARARPAPPRAAAVVDPDDAVLEELPVAADDPPEPVEPPAPPRPEPPRLHEFPPPGPPDGEPIAPPGWYPDPAADGRRRFWDGEVWTTHVWRRERGDDGGRRRRRRRSGYLSRRESRRSFRTFPPV